jgi:hypothetical protein
MKTFSINFYRTPPRAPRQSAALFSEARSVSDEPETRGNQTRMEVGPRFAHA